MGHIWNQQSEEDVQLLDFAGQNGVFIDHAINDRIGCLVNTADFHDVDALFRGRADRNEFTADIFTGTQELMSFQRGQNKDLCSFPAHP